VYVTTASITVDRWDPNGCYTQLFAMVQIVRGLVGTRQGASRGIRRRN
jgi:hypothetical protein